VEDLSLVEEMDVQNIERVAFFVKDWPSQLD
jgi:hypothetical protein